MGVMLIWQREFVAGFGGVAAWPLAALGYIEGENLRRGLASLKTAKAISGEVPTSLLLSADRVIECSGASSLRCSVASQRGRSRR